MIHIKTSFISLQTCFPNFQLKQKFRGPPCFLRLCRTYISNLNFDGLMIVSIWDPGMRGCRLCYGSFTRLFTQVVWNCAMLYYICRWYGTVPYCIMYVGGMELCHVVLHNVGVMELCHIVLCM